VSGTSVYLRVPQATDRKELLRLRRESWKHLARWEPLPPRGLSPYGPAWFTSLLERSASDANDVCLVCRREDDALLGLFSIGVIVRGAHQSAFLGYWVGARYAGQGVMSEALPLLLRHAFGSLGLHRLEANIRPDNAPSIALVRRVGFTKEGYSRRYLKIAGRWHDHERWAILVEDWRRARAKRR